MGEFPEPAIRGSTAPVSSVSTTPTPVPNEPFHPVNPGPSTGNTTDDGEEGTSAGPSSTPVVSTTDRTPERGAETLGLGDPGRDEFEPSGEYEAKYDHSVSSCGNDERADEYECTGPVEHPAK